MIRDSGKQIPHRFLRVLFFSVQLFFFVRVPAQSQNAAKPFEDGILHGKDIYETNTGVPPEQVLTDVNKRIVVTEEWISTVNKGSRVLEKRIFTDGADLVITVDGFIVQYCKFIGKSGISLFANSSKYPLGKNVSILYCEFDGKHENRGDDVAIYGSNLFLKRVHVRRWPRAMWIGDGNVTVVECFFHDITADGGDAHLENVYVAGGTNIAFIRNKLVSNEIHINGDTRLMTSASLAIYNENYERGAPFPSFPHLENILVQDNYLESDGHFALYAGALRGKLPAPFARRLVIKGNIFGRSLHRNSGISGAATAFDPSQPGNEWIGNRWGPRGREWKTGDPEENAAIPAPTPY